LGKSLFSLEIPVKSSLLKQLPKNCFKKGIAKKGNSTSRLVLTKLYGYLLLSKQEGRGGVILY